MKRQELTEKEINFQIKTIGAGSIYDENTGFLKALLYLGFSYKFSNKYKHTLYIENIDEFIIDLNSENHFMLYHPVLIERVYDLIDKNKNLLVVAVIRKVNSIRFYDEILFDEVDNMNLSEDKKEIKKRNYRVQYINVLKERLKLYPDDSDIINQIRKSEIMEFIKLYPTDCLSVSFKKVLTPINELEGEVKRYIDFPIIQKRIKRPKWINDCGGLVI